MVSQVRLAILDVRDDDHNAALDRLTAVSTARPEMRAIIEEHEAFAPLHDHPRFHYLVGWA